MSLSSINDPIETPKLSHEDVTLDYTLMRQGNSRICGTIKKTTQRRWFGCDLKLRIMERENDLVFGFPLIAKDDWLSIKTGYIEAILCVIKARS